MSQHDLTDAASARRHSRVIAHLEGKIDTSTIAAMHHAWSRLEEIAPTGTAHARAVRERMFWSSVTSADGATVVPLFAVPEVVPVAMPATDSDSDAAFVSADAA